MPGQTPHPQSDERGHSYGHSEPPAQPLDEASWRENETWLYAADLFNHGYYWEAHEAWEALWHAAGRKGPTADFLKGLIKLAAAGVKGKEGRPEGVVRHARRAAELLAPAEDKETCFGLEVAQPLGMAKRIVSTSDSSDLRQRLEMFNDFRLTLRL